MAGPYFLFLLILAALCSGTRAHTAATNSTSVESRARRSTANATTDDRNLEQRPNFTQASCSLPVLKGNCSEIIRRYFFTDGQCKSFNYSGCGGNSNRFSTIEDCMAACGDPCTAPVSTVSCPKSPSIRGFYYDQAMDTCLQFETGRCGGSNINNFQSKEECEHRCVKDACELKPQPVPCKDRTNNTYYDTKTHSCRNVDDGCLGNANSFASVQDCQDRCMMKNHTCSLPLDQGRPCAPNVRYFYYDVKSKKCKSEEQCDVTGNTFLTHSQCSWTCEENACVQGWAPSSCDASVARYFYNLTTRECEILHSGKCSSNMNNFESKDQCQHKCSSNDICKLSMSSGSCNGSEPRWYFKNETGQCEKFSYGGCEGNDNNFLSEAICEKACIQNPCQSPKYPVPCGTPQQNYYYDSKLGKCFFTNVTCFGKGNSFLTLEQCNRTCKTDNPCLATVKISCKTTHTHYYYDTRSGQCTRFNYTGCGGNTNNYKSLEDCKKVCKNKHKTIIDDGSTLSGERESNLNPTLESDEPKIGPERNGYRCILPLEVGSCNKTLKRFYFNSSTHSCRQFIYSDCQGNANNFLTMKACTKTCMDICHAPVEMRSCNVTVTRYHYNSTSGMCEQLPYNRCSNSLNNFQELDTCEKICVTDVCIQRKKTGPCKRYLKRFYYDPKSDQCLPFIYGGCHRNGNNFLSHEDCQRQCFHLNPCVAPAKIETSCNEASKFTRFHYNRMKGVCEKHFRCTAGGFKSLSSCEAKCSVNVCILPSEHGPCDLDRERYYYSQESKKCRPFLYGGCHGNTNNFGTLEGCVSRCEPDRCTQPEQVGLCDQSFKRYFYDSKTNSCHRFIYSGCGGNSNNFPTVTSCQNSCGTQKCDQSLDNGTACSVCELKPEEIDCAHSSRRLHFYYNSSAGRCMNFEMGKCGSDNGNSFSSLDECGKKCIVNVCQLPPLPTSCSAKSDGNVYYDMKTDTCKSFGTGICGANRNSFSDFRQCESKCVKDICHLTNDVGPCKAAVKRIFYNRLTGNCEVFQYGGCGGNKNNFVIRQDCENRCMKDPCKLSKDPGRCSAYFPQYYYNSEDNRCHSFIYGGCGGNQNRFETIDACLQRCQPNICNLPPDTGPCRAFLPRFYYNTALGKCNNFIYGGCKGNANNFKTIKNCEATCLKDPCDQPFKVGPCEARIERFYFNSMTGKCERFYYGGCDANENNFKTVEECQKRCARDPCSLPPDAGTCHHKLTHFYFDLATGRCLNFIYSGCGGNANRFLSVKQCAQICIQNRCKKEMDPGRCDKKLTRFFYDSKRGQCVSFIYGGCGGNTNNFQSAKLCKDVCLNENPCLQPKMPGPCRGSFKRFYYDSVEGKCSVFYYGGCDGNRNNFHTLSTCQNTCATERTNGISKCHLPKDQGSCSSQEQRFFYNPTLQSCEPFTYTGCAGNANNFLSERQCERECKFDPCKQPRIAGSCSRSEKRWYFDEKSQLCRAFNYSGCGANGNNFQGLEDCEQQCVKPTCRPERAIGPCNQNLPRFYYNWEHGRCYQFNYTGCYGNENRFMTMKHCQETCPIDPCLQPLFITGYCSGRKKYFYNREYGICQAFIFKGCQANGNIFASSEECHKSCQHMYEIDLGRLRNTSFRQN